MNVTFPVGVPVPPPAAVTVAVNAIAWPNVLGLGELSSAIELAVLFTVCFTVALDDWKLLSPTYDAVIVCNPTESEATFSDALPFASNATEPSDAAPSVKITLPVGIVPPPVDGATVTENETA
jgi:hypothetical protein